jgi:hypothetical protein
MIIGSHNSWSYLPPKKWWMKLISFTAKCQSLNIKKQYELGVRCFDLRIKFTKDGFLRVAHGIIEYNYSSISLASDLEWLNNQSDQVYIRILHEVRSEKEYTKESVDYFVDQIISYQCNFTNLKFWCGRNLYNWKCDYEFPYKPSCEEKYASVCSPKLIDDWYPRLFAYLNNKKIIKEGTDKDILLIDFVNYGH